MRKTCIAIGSSMVLLASLASAQAQSSTNNSATQNNSASTSSDQSDMSKTTIRQQIQSQLTKNGFTDVTVQPSSFYVHAKNKKGEPVAMVVGPDSVTEVTEMPANKSANANEGGSSTSGTKTSSSKP